VADHLFPAGEQVDVAVRPPAGWELPIRLATADAVGGPALAVDGRGCSVAAWSLERGLADTVVQTAKRCSGQFFGDAQQLSAGWGATASRARTPSGTPAACAACRCRSGPT